MSVSLFQIGYKQTVLNAKGDRILKFTVDVSHKGLKEHKVLTAPEEEMLDNKISMQANKWAEKWERLESKRLANREKEANLEEANSRTDAAIEANKQIDNILIHTLSVDDKVNWDKLKKKDPFIEKVPKKSNEIKKEEYPKKPNKSSSSYTPKFSFIEKILKSKRELKQKEYDKRYSNAISEWEKEKHSIDLMNIKHKKDFQEEIKKWENDVKDWEIRKERFLEKQKLFNLKIDKMREAYLNLNDNSIAEYCEMVLNNSVYPDTFPQNFELEYNPVNKILIVEYEMPSSDNIPNVKEVKYIASRKELKEYFISEAQINKMFDETVYKITLRTLHELFEADVANAIDAVSFNGWVKSINKATGREENNCILSIQAKKMEFMEIDLGNVDPKLCFKKLKGVASSKLSSITPVQPIVQISRADKRFVNSYDVAGGIDNSTNLAAMDWEDFEHLIRELFEKEFQNNGGEVKVTRASRDGGVDAIAFDPDPIRGGKIVIQAKRYTNTVGVSAVRDLYGTVVNEGATKGILVSTADYGPDAYEFAKGKPITLLNGGNLLHLLGKHGHHAKIDLKEAKIILAEKDK